MQLVITYAADSGTYECGCNDIILPIEYESAEALICDFETALDKAKEDASYNKAFKIGNETFYVNDFYIHDYVYKPNTKQFPTKHLPEIYTLEEWFQKFRIL